jgi:transketolase
MVDIEQMERLYRIVKLIRYYILISTTKAGSGHPTSALSATDLMAALLFGGFFRYNPENPDHPNNDRIIFSKGHATPLFYAIWAAAGQLSEEDLMTYRKFGSTLEGHPTPSFPHVVAATGSLGQGLSIGFGLALNAKYLDKLPYRTFVLLGDSEMAEGSQWEAIQLAAHYGLDNLVGILDVNRLGQRGETMYGHDLSAYERRISAFGWETVQIDGHSFVEILDGYDKALNGKGKPVMIIAKTVKGKGVSLFENQNGWHGKALKKEQLANVLAVFGKVDKTVRGEIAKPEDLRPPNRSPQAAEELIYQGEDSVATREAYGNALQRIFVEYPQIVSLDGEVSNSTKAEIFKEEYPERFFEMYIAEQNMIGAALALSSRGKIPFVSTFAAFMTRGFDQIRMSQYSGPNIKFVGSHAGVAIGQDGPSQMGLEDIAMFRTILNSVVLYPADAVATEKLVEEAASHKGIVYIRTTRNATPVIYQANEEFPIGGCKVLRQAENDEVTVIAAGVTIFQALEAYEELLGEDISIRVIDLYSVKPIDAATLREATKNTSCIITVEDHYAEGGIGEAVLSSLSPTPVPVHILAVRNKPKSGRPEDLLSYGKISKDAIVSKVKEALGK